MANDFTDMSTAALYDYIRREFAELNLPTGKRIKDDELPPTLRSAWCEKRRRESSAPTWRNDPTYNLRR